MNDRYCVLLGPVARFTQVQRLRLAPGDVVETVAEIRRLVSESGHLDAEWWVGDSATPRDLAKRLLELGLVRAERPPHEPRFTAMALVDAPAEVPGVVARPVETFEEYELASDIAENAFAVPESERAEWRRIARERWEIEKAPESRVKRFLAWVDGQPAATATAVFGDAGALLIGGSTLPEARGRGAYRALVRTRWDEAVRRGTPGLVVQAGAMSRPILERLGFQPVCRIEALLDPSSA